MVDGRTSDWWPWAARVVGPQPCMHTGHTQKLKTAQHHQRGAPSLRRSQKSAKHSALQSAELQLLALPRVPLLRAAGCSERLLGASSMRTWGCAAPPLACSTQRRVAAHQPSTTCLLLRHSRTLRAPPSWPPVSSLRAMPQRNGDNPQLPQPPQEQASVDRSDAEVPCLVVFDLDACLWLPEMYQLDHPPGQWDEKAAGVRAGKQVCATPSPLALKHLLSPLVFTSRLCASSRGPSTRSRRWQRSRGFATQRWPSPPAQQGRPLRTL